MKLEKTGWWLKVACGTGLIVNLCVRYVIAPETPLFPPLPGQLLAISGGLCSLYHGYILRRAIGDRKEPARLVTRGGLFPYIRHPMYAGDALLYLGLALLAPGLASLLMLLLGWLGLYRQARAEDRYLAQRFQGGFEAWRRDSRLL